MERPGWRPKRQLKGGVEVASTDEPKRRGASSSKEKAAPAERWPPIGSQTLEVVIARANNLPKADRAAHSDPYCTCCVLGKPRSRAKTSTLEDTEDPVWNETLLIPGWRKGDSLELSIYDYDIVGADDIMATVQVPAADIRTGFEARLSMKNTWEPGGERVDEHIEKYNRERKPTIDLKIVVQDYVVTGKREVLQPGVGSHALGMPGARPTLGQVCQHLDDFDVGTQPVPHVGNFWMTPRMAQ